MRSLFLVLAKLFGLLQLYYGLIAFMQLVPVLFTMRTEFPVQIFGNLVGTAFFLAVSIGMAWLLLVRTEWLADKLKIRDETGIGGLDKEPILLVGVKLIGVYVTVHAIPALVGCVVELRWIWWSSSEWRVWSRIVSSVLELGLGVFLMLQSTKVVEMITERKRVPAADARR